MGIVNRTPDSFFDQGRTYVLEHAVEAAVAAADAGAGWVDIGGVPFSPETPEVGLSDELDRVVPVVERVAAARDIVISVDTFRPEVAARSIAGGAAVINDPTGLHDPELAECGGDPGCDPGDHPQLGTAAGTPSSAAIRRRRGRSQGFPRRTCAAGC